VIENEFGEQGIDDDLLKASEKMQTEEIIETINGCVCCTVRKDLIEVINRVLKEKKGKFDYIIIESTGK
jgi:G3E family GTPase